MEHTEEYLQAEWVTQNPDGYDERDVLDAKRYCNAYLDGYNQALRINDIAERSEQLVCDHPDEAIIRDKPTDYCLACNRNI